MSTSQIQHHYQTREHRRNVRQVLTLIALLLAFCLMMLLAAGCMTPRDAVPATEISGTLNGKPFRFVGPKDMKAGLLQFTTTTNGEISVTVSNLEAHTNPEIITMTADGYAKMRKADYEGLQGLIQTGGAMVR